MEVNTTYNVNIISQIDKEHGLFVAVEQFNSGSTGYFQHYYKQLLLFNDCTEWFQQFDYPVIEFGKVIIVQVDKNIRFWARGIISNCHNYNNLCPEVYLIDSQRFIDKDTVFEMRTCPPKFLQLILPTYFIDINLCLDDDDLKAAITILINKNQYGELSFSFTPKSVENNVYSGELIVYNKVNNLYIPLKKLLKNMRSKKIFEEIPLYKNHQHSNFNPIEIKYLKNIFMPREPSKMVFLENNLVSSSLNLSIIDDSNNNLSYNSANEFSSASNFSENSCITPIAKQKVYSSNSSLMSKSNSSLQSASFNNNCIMPEITTDSNINLSYNSANEFSSTSNCSENSCITPIEKQRVYFSNNSLMSKRNSSLQSANFNNNEVPEIKQCNNFVVTRTSKYKKDTACQQDIKSTLTLKVLETPEIHLKSITNFQPIETTIDDSLIWWSDDDDNN